MKEQIWGSVETRNESPSPKLEIYKEPSFVETVRNRIYFYSDIYRAEVLQLNRRLREVNNDLLFEAQVQDREPASIFLHINSFGGSVFAGLSAMDEICNSKVKITTIVDGISASAATFLSVAGTERLIRPHAYMLIHQLSSAFWGKFAEFEDQKKNLDTLMDTIKNIYKEYTKIPVEKLDEILQHDLYFDAQTCVDYGLVDKIA